MVDLKVIQGGAGDGSGRNEINEQAAAEKFGDFVEKLLRALSGGSGIAVMIENLNDFVSHCNMTEVRLGAVFDKAIGDLRGRVFDKPRSDSWEIEESQILEAALKVIVEHLAYDGFARGRLSQRRQVLDQAIEMHLVQSERRSNEHGWSYLDKVKQKAKPPTHTRPSKRRPGSKGGKKS